MNHLIETEFVCQGTLHSSMGVESNLIYSVEVEKKAAFRPPCMTYSVKFLGYPEFVNLIGMRVDHVHSASDAWIERMDCPQDF